MNRKLFAAVLIGILILILLISIFTLSEVAMKTRRLEHYTKVNLLDISAEKWKALADKTIFFGHMSVGFNIMDGVSDILKEKPDIALSVYEAKRPADASTARLNHAAIGHNGDPIAKIAAFRDFVKSMNPLPDIAFMKFCYVDFYAHTESDAVISAYRQTIAELQRDCPETIFLHCTVPLKARPLHVKQQCKEIIKLLLGRPVTIDHNAKREAFSQWLRQTYPEHSILDIARAESVSEEGDLLYKNRKGAPVPFLRSDYTYDGGHLNERGRRHTAQELLAQLIHYAE